MIHVFDYRGKNYIYDVGSGSLHECDRPTADYLKAKEEGADIDVTYLSDEQIREILSDVEGLKEQGLLFKEEVKTYPMKSNEVKALCIHICHDCNFRCRYCFADEGAYHSKRESMSFETAKRAVDFLIENSGKRKVLEMDFFGGEPLMNLDVLKKTVYYAKEAGEKAGKKSLFTPTTNALLLNDEVIEFFNEEMENVVLSLDGRKEVHDAIRKSVNGKGTFDLIIDKIKKFISLRGNKSYYVRGTFTAKNLDFSKDVLFIADQGVDSISMEPVVTDPALPSGCRLAARGTSISRSRPTGICTLVTSSRATKNSEWGACSRGSSVPNFGRNSKTPACSRGRSARNVSRNLSVRAVAARTTTISTATSTSRTKRPAR